MPNWEEVQLAYVWNCLYREHCKSHRFVDSAYCFRLWHCGGKLLWVYFASEGSIYSEFCSQRTIQLIWAAERVIIIVSVTHQWYLWLLLMTYVSSSFVLLYSISLYQKDRSLSWNEYRLRAYEQENYWWFCTCLQSFKINFNSAAASRCVPIEHISEKEMF